MKNPNSEGLAYSKTWRSVVVLLTFLLAAAFANAQSYSIDWYKISGGGGTSAGGLYSVSGTIGQQDSSGPMTNGDYSVTGGFWSLLSIVSVTPRFSGTPTNGFVPLTVSFDNLSSGATAYSWDFGDDQNSTNANPTNVYTNTGAFTVSLTASGPAGTNTLTLTNYVLVLPRFYDGVDLSDTNQLLADWDGDGTPNLVEYALGTNPHNAADGSAGDMAFIAQVGGSGYLELKYKQRVDAATRQLQYIPEVSGDKTNWFSDNAHLAQVSVTPIDAEFNWVTVQDLTPFSPSAPQLIRLRIGYSAIQTIPALSGAK